jgi:hypothetical protein
LGRSIAPGIKVTTGRHANAGHSTVSISVDMGVWI